MKTLLIAITVLLFSGCAAGPEDYRDNLPQLQLETFFNGQLTATGIVTDYRGRMVRRFRADLIADWQGNNGVLDEIFYFADGEVQTRCWRLQRLPGTTAYTGVADDVMGEAAGVVAGNALNWQYQLKVQSASGEWLLNLDDWLYLVDEDNLINLTSMRKFGIEVAQLSLHIGKTAAEPQRPFSSDCQL